MRLFERRGYTAYGGGVLMDFIGHNNDIAQWGLGMEQLGPLRVEARNWKNPLTDVFGVEVATDAELGRPDMQADLTT